MVQAAVGLTLVGCCALAFASARRIGFHTPYGTLLFFVSAGFWTLLASHALQWGNARLTPGASSSPLGVGFRLLGWVLLDGALLVFVLRVATRGWRILVWALAPPLLALAAALALGVRGTSALAYLAFDGLAFGLLAASARSLERRGEAILARLYLVGLAALVALALADLREALFVARGLAAPANEILVALADALALIALALHRFQPARDPLERREAPT